MKTHESSKERVKKICDALRKDTLEPAKLEAQTLLERAREEAAALKAEAAVEVAALHQAAKEQIEKQRKIFEASLQQATRQTIELLREQIEKQLFLPALAHLVQEEWKKPEVIVRLVEAVVSSVEREGLSSDISIVIADTLSARSINERLTARILEMLREKSVVLGPIGSGIVVKFHRDNITIDLSGESLCEVVARFLRKDFAALVFGL